ncbi:hypothetical protein GAY29_18080 [Azospirillum brasilense]|nr:hypothetical protein [Azospirillum brasilense]
MRKRSLCPGASVPEGQAAAPCAADTAPAPPSGKAARSPAPQKARGLLPIRDAVVLDSRARTLLGLRLGPLPNPPPLRGGGDGRRFA